jgi:hypothetical protein
MRKGVKGRPKIQVAEQNLRLGRAETHSLLRLPKLPLWMRPAAIAKDAAAIPGAGRGAPSFSGPGSRAHSC